MQKYMIALTCAGIFALGGCAEAPSRAAAEPAAPAPAAKPSLSAEAKAALAQAEADIKEAKAKKALWTTAKDALKSAKDAAEEFDNAAVIKYSKIASEHAKMGLAQTQYPMTNR